MASPSDLSGKAPVDLAHLSAQTGGDDALAREVLALFATRVASDLARLKDASGAARREIAHLIVGSARAIGAGEVAGLARDIETGDGDLDALAAAVDEARTFVATYLADRK